MATLLGNQQHQNLTQGFQATGQKPLATALNLRESSILLQKCSQLYIGMAFVKQKSHCHTPSIFKSGLKVKRQK